MQLLQDVRLAVRPLVRRPMLIATVSAVLALSVAVSTVLFGALMALRMAPPGVQSPERLAYVYQSWGSFNATDPVLRPFFDVMRTRGAAVGEFTSATRRLLRLSNEQFSADVYGEAVEPNYLSVLRAEMYLGRFLGRSDGGESAELVIGYHLWKSRFAGDPSIIGKRTQVTTQDGTRRYTVVGVTAPGFRGVSDPLKPAQLWIDGRRFSRGITGSMPIIRLSATADMPKAESFLREASRFIQGLAKGDGAFFVGDLRPYRANIGGLRFSAFSARDVQNPRDPRAPMVPRPLLIAILVFIVLIELIVAANVAGLVLSHRAGQARDVAVQRLLGASRGRIVFQRLVEACVLSIPGAVLGIAGAALLLGPLRALTSSRLPLEVHLDWATAMFGVVVAMGAVLVVGAMSFTKTTDNVISGAHATATSLRRGVRLAILVPQIAGSAALLATAGIYLESLTAKYAVNASTSDETLVVTMSRTAEPAASDHGGIALADSVLAAITAVPGVDAAGLVDDVPLRPLKQQPIRVRGRDVVATAGLSVVTDGYFQSLGLGIASGRGFAPRGDADAGAAVISRELSRRLKIDVGAQVSFAVDGSATPATDPWLSVVGVVDDVTPVVGDRTPQPVVYVPATHAQGSRQSPFFSSIGEGVNVTVRTQRPLDAADVRRALATSVPSIEVRDVRSMSALADELLLPTRLAGSALGVAGLCALILSCCGLAGMISYLIAERWREIGIRAALGADRGALIRLFMREGAVCLAFGLVAGSALAVVVLRLLTRILPDPSGGSLIAFLSGHVTIAAAVMLVAWMASRRAADCNPAETLRGL